MSMTVSDLIERLDELEDEGFGDAPVYIDPPGAPNTIYSLRKRERDSPQTDYVEIHH